MGLFGLGKKPSYLGVDLGSTSIKIVELRREKGAPFLVTYGYAEKAMGDVVRGNPEEVQARTVELLKKLCKEAGVSTFRAVTALPNFSVFNSVISLPVMNKKDLASAIRWEAKKFIPIPLEEVILDWKIIEETTKKETVLVNKETKETEIQAGKIFRILLTAASRNLVKRYVEIFRLANLQLLALETEAFALSRALVGKEEAPVMIIDTSAVTTDVIIIEKGIPVLNRSIDVGGVTITRAIANCLNIDFKRAEQFKRDIGLTGSSKVPNMIEQTLKPVVEEISYSLKIYQEQTGQVVEKVILSGGSAYLPNLAEYFTKLLNIKTFVGDPWARVGYPLDLKPALEEIAPRFAVAIGLALRGME
jgi:type IV pilus assembly protein PilM